MNTPAPGPKLRGILCVGAEGLRLFRTPEDGRAVLPGTLGRTLETVDGILLEVPPDAAPLPRRERERIGDALAHLPFFAHVPAGETGALRQWTRGNASVFDRILAASSAGANGDDPLRIEAGSGSDPVALAFEDLLAERTLAFESAESYSLGAHWEERARQLGTSARAVCYANAPRHINKLMHAIQLEALLPAIRRAARDMTRSSTPPALLEYGCGIGRLARYCRPHVRYHGADISRGMIETARQLNPWARFFTTQTLDGAELPPIDIVMIVTVLHRNDREGRLEILRRASRRCRDRLRLILLEDLVVSEQAKRGNMHRLGIDDLLDEIATAFGGSCSQTGFELLAYKPHDLMPRAGLLELDILR